MKSNLLSIIMGESLRIMFRGWEIYKIYSNETWKATQIASQMYEELDGKLVVKPCSFNEFCNSMAHTTLETPCGELFYICENHNPNGEGRFAHWTRSHLSAKYGVEDVNKECKFNYIER